MSLIDDLKLIEEQAAEGIAKAPSLDELDKIRVAVTGKKGSLTGVLRSMGKVSPEERPLVGKHANEVSSSAENPTSGGDAQ